MRRSAALSLANSLQEKPAAAYTDPVHETHQRCSDHALDAVDTKPKKALRTPLYLFGAGSLVSMAPALCTGSVLVASVTALGWLTSAVGVWHLYSKAEAEQARIAAAAKQSHLALTELRHRVGNDFQRMVATLTLQATTNPGAAEALRVASGRASAMARVYQRLGQLPKQCTIDSADLLAGLATDLNATLHGVRPVSIKVAAEAHALPAHAASAVGLITNEVIANALKHAFPDTQAGTVQVAFYRKQDHMVLSISDDGVGEKATANKSQPPSPTTHANSGLGRRLIVGLVGQLGGRFESRPRAGGSGTVCTVTFPSPRIETI